MKTLIKLFSSILFFLSATHFLFAQPTIEWEQNYGGSGDDYARSIQQTLDGGYIVAGESESNDGDVSGNNGNRDYWILKLDGNGNIQWEQNYGGSGFDEPRSIQQTLDGGYIVAGYSSSNDGDVNGNNGNFDYWILKLDATGNVQWEQNYGGSGWDYVNSIQQTLDGGYIVAGNSFSNDGDVSGNNGSFDYWILKLDETGNVQWEQSYGGSDSEYAESIRQTLDGGYIVAGFSLSNNGDVSGNNGIYDYWILKLDGTGNVQWEQNYGGSGDDRAFSIQQTLDGGYIVAGYSLSNDGDVSGNNGNNDYWILKLDGTGNVQWKQNYGGSGTDLAQSIQQTLDGGYIVAGASTSNNGDVSGNNGIWDSWILKLDGTGNVQWEQSYGGSDSEYAQSIQQTLDGGYIVAGYSESNDGDVSGNNGGYDFWIVKLSNDCGCTDPTACNYNPIATCDDGNCQENCETLVYPGDLNHDGIVDNQDVALSGLYLNNYGIARAQEHQNIDWYPHPSQDWGFENNQNVDLKHHDCNGDGLLDLEDQQAITLNMDSIWGIEESEDAPEQSDYLVLLQPIDQVIDGYLIMNVVLERRANADLEVQAGYFTIDYSEIEGNISFATLAFFDENWLGERDVNVWYERIEFPQQKKIDVGFTKIDNLSSNGSGVIAQLILNFDTNVAKRGESSNVSYQFSISDVGIHNNNSQFTLVENQQLNVIVNPDICYSNLVINKDSPFQNLYQSSGNITTNGFVLIGEDQQVEYKANRVTLNSGFSIKVGEDSRFKAGYGNCD